MQKYKQFKIKIWFSFEAKWVNNLEYLNIEDLFNKHKVIYDAIGNTDINHYGLSYFGIVLSKIGCFNNQDTKKIYQMRKEMIYYIWTNSLPSPTPKLKHYFPSSPFTLLK